MSNHKTLTLEILIDRAAIGDVVVRYAAAIDNRDWVLYASCFADHVQYAIPFFHFSPDTPMTRDEVVAFTRAGLGAFDATQHLSTNHVITIDGDDASCVSAMVSRHVLENAEGGNHYTVGGHYVNRLQRTAEGWKIYDCTLNITWAEGNRDIFEQARRQQAS